MLYDNTLSFTDRSWEILYGVVEAEYFQENEARVIYDALRKKLNFVPFGDHLKRYIYRAAGMTEPFGEVPEPVYQQILVDSFRENGVPASFEPTTAKLSMMAKNWLSQQAVRRQVVLLLGFGLRMTEEEVDEILLKALHEQHLNEADPMEVICAFCYRKNLGFSSYERLTREYRAMPDKEPETRNRDEAELMAKLRALSDGEGRSVRETMTEKAYQALYGEAQELIAAMYNTTGYFAGCTAADITESDLEHVLSSAIPVDRHGNLVPASASQLGSRFAEHRISRQRLHRLLNGKSPVTRYDLITLSFFIWSQKKEVADDPRRRYIGFINATNKLLADCSYGEIYPVNPYECFLLMCLLTDVPLSTYADVWEMSFSGN
nr:hypothetical protein [Lachnospiraceae bacterium]